MVQVINTMETNEFTQLSEEIIQAISGDLDVMSSEIFPRDNELAMEDADNEPDDIIILHMDIREPLSKLLKLLEDKLSISLEGYKFYLQDAQELEAEKTLVDQCVKGEGLVQINVQIQTTAERINIVDVLKPTESVLAAMENAGKWQTDNENAEDAENGEESDIEMREYATDKAASVSDNNEKPVLNWVLDSKFKKEQFRLKIPDDPIEWTTTQVKHWFQWAVRQFDLTDIKMSDWTMTGKELCEMEHADFCKKLPHDPGNVFWTHLQLLKECKFVSVVHRSMEEKCTNGASFSPNNEDSSTEYELFDRIEPSSPIKEFKIMRKPVLHGSSRNQLTVSTDTPYPVSGAGGQDSPVNGNANNNGSGSGNNGQVQLWQFLLEILTDREHTDIIQWVGSDGEFKLTDPERVARLWGIKKNKPAMNYEKLSRALRYYYDGDMISKVSGKRFAYKFDCDLKLLIGYDASELAKLVSKKSFVNDAVHLDQLNKKSDEE